VEYAHRARITENKEIYTRSTIKRERTLSRFRRLNGADCARGAAIGAGGEGGTDGE